MAKPTTRFVVPYLTLVGKLKAEAQKLDILFAFMTMKRHYAKLYEGNPEAAKEISQTLDRKGTLLTRPMEVLLKDPHMLSGWLSINQDKFNYKDGRIEWLCNPLVILADTYEYLNMNWREDAPAAEVIWTHDRDLLNNALAFYAELREKFNISNREFAKLHNVLTQDEPQGGYNAATWTKIQQAHVGFECGNELLGLIFMVAENTNFYDFRIEDNLEVTIPDDLNDPDLQASMKRYLYHLPQQRRMRSSHLAVECTMPRKPQDYRHLSPKECISIRASRCLFWKS